MTAGLALAPCKAYLVMKLKTQNNKPERVAAAGRVTTQAIPMFRRVAICRPQPLAAIVPATPDERTCVADTGRPKPSAPGRLETDEGTPSELQHPPNETVIGGEVVYLFCSPAQG
jgi:hypothetical protein